MTNRRTFPCPADAAFPSALELLEERRLFSLEPVLIVPGVMGSLPKTDYVRLWLQNDPLGTAPANLRPEYLTDSYDPIIDAFKQEGYTLGEDLFVATYDWRRPIGLHGVNDEGYPVNDAGADGLPDTAPAQIDSGVEYLNYWIQRAKTITGSPKVDIVGHSMGGLVAREYIQSDYYAGDVDDFVMLGTPNHGSAKTAEMWLFGEPFDTTQDYFGSVFEQARKIYEGDYRNVAGLPEGLDDFTSFLHAYVPGVRDLLPVYDYQQDLDSSSPMPRDPGENPWLDALNAPEQLVKYADRGVEVTIVGGCGLDTPKTLVLTGDGQAVDHYHYADGDGSVLFGYSSGTIRTGSVFLEGLANNASDRLESEHVELLRNEDSVDAVMAGLHLPALHGDFDQSTAGLISTWWRASGWWNSGSLLAQARAELTSHPQSIFFSSGTKAVYFDSSGDKVTVSLSGGGEGELRFARAVPVGDRLDAQDMILSGTTTGSRVSVSIDRHGTSIGSITVDGSLASLSAGVVKLTGDLDVTGSLTSLRLGDVISGATVTVGESAGPASMAFGRVADLSIDSPSPLTSLSAADWRDTAGPGEQVRSPWIDRLSVGGEFAPDLILTGAGLPAGTPLLGSASVTGRASGNLWDIPGDAGTITLGGLDAAMDIDGSCRSLRLGDWAAMIPPRDGVRGSIRVGGSAGVVAHGTPMPIVDDTLYVTTSSMYGLEDLRGFAVPGASWSYTANYGTASRPVSGAATVSVAGTSEALGGLDYLRVTTLAGALTASGLWRTDEAGTNLGAWTASHSLGDFDVTFATPLASPPLMPLGRRNSSASTFTGLALVHDGAADLTGAMTGSATFVSQLLGHEVITVGSGAVLAVKAATELTLSGTISLTRNGKPVTARFSARQKQTFWALPGEGIVKASLSTTLTVSIPGLATRSVTLPAGLILA